MSVHNLLSELQREAESLIIFFEECGEPDASAYWELVNRRLAQVKRDSPPPTLIDILTDIQAMLGEYVEALHLSHLTCAWENFSAYLERVRAALEELRRQAPA